MEIIPLLFLWLGVGPTGPDVSLDDLRLFPPPAVAREMRDVVTAKTRLARWGELPLIRSEAEYQEWRDYCAAAEWVWDVWDDLHLAHQGSFKDDWRLARLRDLRRKIGCDAYYHGCLPPPPVLPRGMR